MVVKDTESEISRLQSLVKQHAYRYHTLGKPIIKDSEYDDLVNTLTNLEKVNNHTPTEQVGAMPSKDSSKVRHTVPMLSLANAFTKCDLTNFIKRVSNIVKDRVEFSVELKLDGLALSLVYENGTLIQASTRGNGVTGEDVTDRVLGISNIPNSIPQLSTVPVFEVRGEVLITNADLELLNATLENKYLNARNAASGLLRTKYNKDNINGSLSFYAYSLITGNVNDIKTQTQSLDYLQSLGFSVVPHYTVSVLEDIQLLYEEHISKRDSLEMDIDGIVIKLNSFSDCVHLGSSSTSPNWAIAYKFPALIKLTKLTRVEWDIGRTGVITPVGVVEPVRIGGVTISRVNLHNPAEISRLDLHVGDTISVCRAGDVIPKVLRTWKDLRSSDCSPVKIPKECPICGSELEEYKCINTECSAILINSFIHYRGKEAMDISGLSKGLITTLYNSGCIKQLPDLYTLTESDLVGISGLADTSIRNLLLSINDSKKTSLSRFIYALGIKGVGLATANALAYAFGSLNELLEAEIGDIQAIKNIGDSTAISIYTYFSNPVNIATISKLMSLGIEFTNNKQEPLAGQQWCFTGTLETMFRYEAMQEVSKLGGYVTTTVNANTDVLVYGEDYGSKYHKAKRLGIRTLSEAKFISLLDKIRRN